MGVTGDLGVHKADLMRWLLGQEFAEVGGFISTLDKRDADGKLIDLDDNAYLTLRTNAGDTEDRVLGLFDRKELRHRVYLFVRNAVKKEVFTGKGAIERIANFAFVKVDVVPPSQVQL